MHRASHGRAEAQRRVLLRSQNRSVWQQPRLPPSSSGLPHKAGRPKSRLERPAHRTRAEAGEQGTGAAPHRAVLGHEGGSDQERLQQAAPRTTPLKGLEKDSGSTASISTSWANHCRCGRRGRSGELPRGCGDACDEKKQT